MGERGSAIDNVGEGKLDESERVKPDSVDSEVVIRKNIRH